MFKLELFKIETFQNQELKIFQIIIKFEAFENENSQS